MAIQADTSEAQLRANFAMKCREWVRRAEEQKTRAQEMAESARKMRDGAEEMVRRAHRAVLL